tara:strand:+ start:71 stop:568 length:498 start_codon:yes stop_codon:yes gene_type:complete
MKIEVKYNIDFGKALKVLNEQSLDKYINADLADKTARLARDYITDGKVKPKLSDNNPRRIQNKKARPLFDTGKLAYSLKGTSQGITGIDYAKEHRQEIRPNVAYDWVKGGKTLEVPTREFIPHFKDSAKGRRVVALRGTKSALTKIYEDFEKKFIRLLNKRIRKR